MTDGRSKTISINLNKQFALIRDIQSLFLVSIMINVPQYDLVIESKELTR
jgi:hypothetical protein